MDPKEKILLGVEVSVEQVDAIFLNESISTKYRMLRGSEAVQKYYKKMLDEIQLHYEGDKEKADSVRECLGCEEYKENDNLLIKSVILQEALDGLINRCDLSSTLEEAVLGALTEDIFLEAFDILKQTTIETFEQTFNGGSIILQVGFVNN